MQRMRRLRTTQARLCPSICAAGLLLLIRAAGKALFSELLGDGKSYWFLRARSLIKVWIAELFVHYAEHLGRVTIKGKRARGLKTAVLENGKHKDNNKEYILSWPNLKILFSETTRNSESLYPRHYPGTKDTFCIREPTLNFLPELQSFSTIQHSY